MQGPSAPLWCGRWPDFYLIGTAPVAGLVPMSGPTQERIICGDFCIPFPEIVPIY